MPQPGGVVHWAPRRAILADGIYSDARLAGLLPYAACADCGATPGSTTCFERASRLPQPCCQCAWGPATCRPPPSGRQHGGQERTPRWPTRFKHPRSQPRPHTAPPATASRYRWPPPPRLPFRAAFTISPVSGKATQGATLCGVGLKWRSPVTGPNFGQPKDRPNIGADRLERRPQSITASFRVTLQHPRHGIHSAL